LSNGNKDDIFGGIPTEKQEKGKANNGASPFEGENELGGVFDPGRHRDLCGIRFYSFKYLLNHATQRAHASLAASAR
jgi:hypothetical protein